MPIELHTNHNSAFESRWQWLPWGYRSQYDLRLALKPGQLRELVHPLITQVLPQSFRSAGFVTDMRGKDSNLPGLAHSPQLNAATGKEEVLYVQGTQAIAKNDEDEEPISQDFSLQIETTFDHFEGPRHIVYSIHRRKTGLAEDRNELELLLDPNTLINGIRIGFEIFEPRFLTIFGFSPIPNFLLQIEGDSSGVALRITSEGLRQPSHILKKGGGVIDRFNQVTMQVLGFRLLSDLEAKV